MKRTSVKHSKPQTPRGRRGAPPDGDDMNQATTSDFEREDLGIAPKE